MKWKTDAGGWSPYLSGALVGLLAITSVFLTTNLLGKSTYLGASHWIIIPVFWAGVIALFCWFEKKKL